MSVAVWIGGKSHETAGIAATPPAMPHTACGAWQSVLCPHPALCRLRNVCPSVTVTTLARPYSVSC